MKRLMSAALALALLSGTAASADPWGYGPRGGHHERYDRGWGRGWDHRHHDDGAGTAVAVGVGLLALTAIIAASDRDRDERRVRAYDYPPPPPPPSYQDRYYDPAPGNDRDYRGPEYQNQPSYNDGYGPDQ